MALTVHGPLAQMVHKVQVDQVDPMAHGLMARMVLKVLKVRVDQEALKVL